MPPNLYITCTWLSKVASTVRGLLLNSFWCMNWTAVVLLKLGGDLVNNLVQLFSLKIETELHPTFYNSFSLYLNVLWNCREYLFRFFSDDVRYEIGKIKVFSSSFANSVRPIKCWFHWAPPPPPPLLIQLLAACCSCRRGDFFSTTIANSFNRILVKTELQCLCYCHGKLRRFQSLCGKNMTSKLTNTAQISKNSKTFKFLW